MLNEQIQQKPFSGRSFEVNDQQTQQLTRRALEQGYGRLGTHAISSPTLIRVGAMTED